MSDILTLMSKSCIYSLEPLKHQLSEIKKPNIIYYRGHIFWGEISDDFVHMFLLSLKYQTVMGSFTCQTKVFLLLSFKMAILFTNSFLSRQMEIIAMDFYKTIQKIIKIAYIIKKNNLNIMGQLRISYLKEMELFLKKIINYRVILKIAN